VKVEAARAAGSEVAARVVARGAEVGGAGGEGGAGGGAGGEVEGWGGAKVAVA